MIQYLFIYYKKAHEYLKNFNIKLYRIRFLFSLHFKTTDNISTKLSRT